MSSSFLSRTSWMAFRAAWKRRATGCSPGPGREQPKGLQQGQELLAAPALEGGPLPHLAKESKSDWPLKEIRL